MGRRETVVHALWAEAHLKRRKWADVGGFIATQGHGVAWAWLLLGPMAAAGAHVRVHGSDAATVSVHVYGS